MPLRYICRYTFWDNTQGYIGVHSLINDEIYCYIISIILYYVTQYYIKLHHITSYNTIYYIIYHITLYLSFINALTNDCVQGYFVKWSRQIVDYKLGCLHWLHFQVPMNEIKQHTRNSRYKMIRKDTAQFHCINVRQKANIADETNKT